MKKVFSLAELGFLARPCLGESKSRVNFKNGHSAKIVSVSRQDTFVRPWWKF